MEASSLLLLSTQEVQESLEGRWADDSDACPGEDS